MDCRDHITEDAEHKKGQHLGREEERGTIQHLKRQGDHRQRDRLSTIHRGK